MYMTEKSLPCMYSTCSRPRPFTFNVSRCCNGHPASYSAEPRFSRHMALLRLDTKPPDAGSAPHRLHPSSCALGTVARCHRPAPSSRRPGAFLDQITFAGQLARKGANRQSATAQRVFPNFPRASIRSRAIIDTTPRPNHKKGHAN